MSGLVRMAIDRYVNLVDSISGEQYPHTAVTDKCEVLTVTSTLQNVTPCTAVEVYQNLKGKFWLRFPGEEYAKLATGKQTALLVLATCFILTSTLNNEAVLYSETLVNF